MKDTLFVQFYSRIENTNPRFKGHSIFELCNGFSDAYELCKSKGDFYWVNHSKQLNGYGNNVIEEQDETLPIESGTVHVSVYYLSQLYQAYKWALKYPNIEFIIGGPASIPNVFKTEVDFVFPTNMKITQKTVEEYFGEKNFSYYWNLDVPGDDTSMTLSYTYTLSSICYWGKCIYCNYSQGGRQRPSIGYEWLDVKYDGKQRVNLYTPALKAKQLRDLFSNLNYYDNIRYDVYVRGNMPERVAMDDAFKTRSGRKFPQTKFIIGVEFPSARMLKYMNKNMTVEDVLITSNMIAGHAHEEMQIQLPFILGWNNLTKNDLVEMDNFLSQLPYDKVKITFSANMLAAKLGTPVYDTYEKGKELRYGPFIYGFMPKISEEQLNYSKEAIELLYNQGVTVFDYHNIRGM